MDGDGYQYDSTTNTTRKMGKKSMRAGGGGRFARLKGKLESEGKSAESAGAIAASAGRKKYGAAQMSKWSAAGRKRAG